jgi:sulfur-oxidizing protein SoxX
MSEVNLFNYRMVLRLVLLIVIYLQSAGATTSKLEHGQALAFDRQKGNCLACHAMAGGTSAGNIGPELINMKARYPDQTLLRQRIWDETMFNPITVMPPFGKHKILTEQEIDLVVEYIHSL